MSTDLILTYTNDLLGHLQIEAETNVNYDDQSGYYHIQLKTDNPGMLIGYRGETLAALQLMLGLLINRGTETGEETGGETEWKRVLLNVNDYRQRREETLQQLAQNAAQKVKFSGEPYYFDNLSPAERRAIHMALQEDDEIDTFSEGEGNRRRLVVTRK